MTTEPAHVEFDDTSGAQRTTATLLQALVARLQTLQVVTGTQALGSLVAGLAQLGQQAAATAEGARVRAALSQTRVGANGQALWSSLGMEAAWSAFPPAPVLEDVRNDLALLLATDLAAVLAELDAVDASQSIGPLREPQPIDCLDLVVGMWAYAREIVGAIDTLVAPVAIVEVQAPTGGDQSGPVLR